MTEYFTAMFQRRAVCTMKSIYVILCAIGLELWMTDLCQPGPEEISVADWLDSRTFERDELPLFPGSNAQVEIRIEAQFTDPDLKVEGCLY